MPIVRSIDRPNGRTDGRRTDGWLNIWISVTRAPLNRSAAAFFFLFDFVEAIQNSSELWMWLMDGWMTPPPTLRRRRQMIDNRRERVTRLFQDATQIIIAISLAVAFWRQRCPAVPAHETVRMTHSKVRPKMLTENNKSISERKVLKSHRHCCWRRRRLDLTTWWCHMWCRVSVNKLMAHQALQLFPF